MPPSSSSAISALLSFSSSSLTRFSSSSAASTGGTGTSSSALSMNATSLESEIYPILVKTEASFGVVLAILGMATMAQMFRVSMASKIKYVYKKTLVSLTGWVLLFVALMIRAITATNNEMANYNLLHTATVLEEMFLYLEWIFWAAFVRSLIIQSRRNGTHKNILARSTSALAILVFYSAAFIVLVIVDLQNLCFKVGLCTSHFMALAFGTLLVVVLLTILFTFCSVLTIWQDDNRFILREYLGLMLPAIVSDFLYSIAFLYCDNTGKPEPDFSSSERALVDSLPANVIPHDMEEFAEFVTARFCVPLLFIFISEVLIVYRMATYGIPFVGYQKTPRYTSTNAMPQGEEGYQDGPVQAGNGQYEPRYNQTQRQYTNSSSNSSSRAAYNAPPPARSGTNRTPTKTPTVSSFKKNPTSRSNANVSIQSPPVVQQQQRSAPPPPLVQTKSKSWFSKVLSGSDSEGEEQDNGNYVQNEEEV